MRLVLLLIISFGHHLIMSQVSLTDFSTYSQNFNGISTGSDGASFTWSNNTSLTGWYLSPTTTYTESSLSGMNNTGAPYVIVSGSDKSLGGRASGTSPNNNIYWGVRLKNNTGLAITSLEISYYGEQWSIAENQTNVNTIAFHWQKSTSSITSLTSGSWTAASALQFTQLYTSSQSSGMGGSACSGNSAQCLSLNGNSSSNRVLISATITVMLDPGDEIMLRWYDVNDAANDHHLQIDDLTITPIAAVVLPVELTDLSTACIHGTSHVFQWKNGDESELDHYRLEFSSNGFDIQNGDQLKPQGNDQVYRVLIPVHSNQKYVRLVSINLNGIERQSPWQILPCTAAQTEVYPNPANQYVELNLNEDVQHILFLDQSGKEVASFDASTKMVDLRAFSSGVYYLRIQYSETIQTKKLIIMH